MRVFRFSTTVVVGFLVGACAPVGTSPTPSGPAGSGADWPSYNRTLAGDRFSPLSQIDRSNVSTLQQVCVYTLPEVAALQAGPVVVGGTMYFSTDALTYAIDAATCAETWKSA